MCKTIYRYILLIATSFGACAGLYLACLTKWLWPYPIHDFSPNNWPGLDWRDLLVYSGLIEFIVFTPGVLIVIRAKPKEIQYYALFLIIPFIVTLVSLILLMLDKDVLWDPTDWYLLGEALGLLAVIMNSLLLVNEIKHYGRHQLISTAKHSEENAV